MAMPARDCRRYLLAELLEQFVAVESGCVAVGESEADGVATDELPVDDFDFGVVLVTLASVKGAEDVAFAGGGCAGGCCTEFSGGDIGFGVVLPADGDFVSDELNVFWLSHFLGNWIRQ